MSTIRRSTLQPISASQFNSRPSLGPSSRPGSIGATGGKSILSASVGGGNNQSSLASSRLSMSQPGVVRQPSLGAPVQSLGGAARKSLGQGVAAGGGGGLGGGAQMGAARTSTLGAPTQSMGMSMGVGGGGGTSTRADPRPITDKGFMTASIRTLLNFLMENGYDSSISPKILARPSSKDFNNIVTFLLRMVDPNFNDGTVKFEDEVPLVFKSLGYPFSISKTALYAVGSPHTWPGLLAAVTWLIELLSYDVTVQRNPVVHPPPQLNGDPSAVIAAADRNFFAYLAGAYGAFLAGDDDRYGMLEDELVASFDSGNVELEREAERVAVENDEIVGKMEELQQRSGALQALQKREEDLRSDLAKFHQLIQQLNDHKDALEKKVESRAAELHSNNTDHRAVSDRCASLRTRISRQELSAEDVRRMQGDRARLEDGLERAAALKEEHGKALWDATAELNKRVEEVEMFAQQYNKKCHRLELAPETARYSGGKTFLVEVDTNAVGEGDGAAMLGRAVDLNGIVRPAIAQLKETVLGKMNTARQELLELLDQEEKAEDILTDALKSAETLENKARRSEETYNREKEQLDLAIAELARETEDSETKIAQLRDPVAMETAIARNTVRIGQLNVLRAEKQEAQQARREAVKQEILAAMSLASDHKDYMESQIKALRAFVVEKVEEIRAGAEVLPPVPPSASKRGF